MIITAHERDAGVMADVPRPVARRLASIVAAAYLFGTGMLAVPGAPPAAAQSPQLLPFGRWSTTYDVTYTPGTTVLDPALVPKILKSVSPDDSTYTFSGSVPQLMGLHAGNVLLIGGRALRRVTSVSRTGGRTVVTTVPATLLEAIKNGHIGWDVNFPTDVVTSSLVRVSVGGGLHQARPAFYPAVAGLGPEAGCLGCPSGPATVDYKGTIDGFDVNLHFDESSLAGLVMNLSARKDDGSMLLKAEAHLRTLNDFDDIWIKDSQLKSFDYREGDLTGDTTVEWHAATSDAVSSLEKIVTLHIPVSFSVPFSVGPIPMLLAIKASLAAYPAISEKGASGGKVEVEYNSALDITGSGSGVHASGSLSKVQFRVTGETVTAGFAPATGFGVDVEAPRIELSIFGTATLFGSILAHLAGYFTPGTTLPVHGKIYPPCQKVSGDAAVYTGAALTIFGLKNLTVFKKAYESNQWESHKPGTCGPPEAAAGGN
jgi:hypothetical protein